MLSTTHSVLHGAVAAALLALVACGSGGDGDSQQTGGHTNSAGFNGYGGAKSFGGYSAAGQTTYPLGGRIASSSGGETSGTSASGSPSSGGTFQARGGAGPGGGVSSGSGGTLGLGGSTGVPTAGFPSVVPPPAAADGSSPYLRECHGDTKSCVDVANLRCLGIRDGTQVNGYSCSNPCQTEADCSMAPSGAAATASCVDFVNQKHCLFVCQSNGMSRACPTGMNCYVYPGSAVGYCLWAP